jgi:hypothetical protein
MSNDDASPLDDATPRDKFLHESCEQPPKNDGPSKSSVIQKRSKKPNAGGFERGLKLTLNEKELQQLGQRLKICAKGYFTEASFTGFSESETNCGLSVATNLGENQPSAEVWERIVRQMNSSFAYGRGLWAFATNLETMPSLTPCGEEARLARICALRVAANTRHAQLEVATKHGLLAVLAELLTNPVESGGRKAKAQKLYMATLSDLRTTVSAIDDRIGISFLTKSSYFWLDQFLTMARYGLLPDNWLVEQISQLVIDHKKIQRAVKDGANQRLDSTEAPNPSVQSAAAKEPSYAGPSMRVLESLDVTIYGDTKKAEYARQFFPLTECVPLTTLPPLVAVRARLGALQQEMPNFAPMIRELLADFTLASWAGDAPVLHLKPMLLNGPPGIGKTRFIKKLAAALDAAWSLLTPAGDADNRNFAGTARGYGSSQPSWPVDQIRRHGRPNPILIVDEIEKAGGSDQNGFIEHALLPLLESESAKLFNDPFLGGPINLSAVSWIFLANSAEGLSQPFKSRITPIHIEPPGLETFGSVLRNILVDIAGERRIEVSTLPELPLLSRDWLKGEYAKSMDLRRLKTLTGKVLAILAEYESDHSNHTLH